VTDVLTIALQSILALTSLILILLILLHKGRGGGMSDMFGGGASSGMGGSSIAERNLDRLTISVGLVWFTVIVLLNLLTRFGI
jgi:preprotein translocase subunit SecG